MSKSLKTNKNNYLPTGFNPNSPLVTTDMVLDYLAQLTVEIYLDMKEREHRESKRTTEKSSHLLPSVNKGTS